MRRVLLVVALVGCAGNLRAPDPYAPADRDTTQAGPGGVPDVRCAGTPPQARRGFRHTRSRVYAALGHPDHRGHDLIADSGAARQVIAGTLGYTVADKKLEDEDVELFACRDAGWVPLGRTRTDGEGRFTLALAGPDRLPDGLRDLYVAVPGDGSGARFLAYVAPRGTRVVVTDVDGTLTASENAYPKSIFLGGAVGVQPGAAEALRGVAASGYQLVYVTARGERFTDATRRWLAGHGFPRGPLRLARSSLTMPGRATLDYKCAALRELSAFELAAGIGNRRSDVAAYGRAGLTPARIWIVLPEFAREIAAAAATGFTSYAALPRPPGS